MVCLKRRARWGGLFLRNLTFTPSPFFPLFCFASTQANRRRQEEERARRLEEEEKRKQELERLAALERESERQKQIERANKILFESSEKVKNLHSKCVLPSPYLPQSPPS